MSDDNLKVVSTWYDDERTIIHANFKLGWTWDDFYKSQTAVQELVAGIDYGVYVIVDMTDTRLAPNAIVHGRKIINMRTYDREMIVFVGIEGMFKQLLSMGKKILPTEFTSFKYAIAETVDEALTIINEHKGQAST